VVQRRRLLEDWMEKLLSDIDISRSAPVAIFLELEAAARSCRCFSDASHSLSVASSHFIFSVIVICSATY